jgi:hypothetical protein
MFVFFPGRMLPGGGAVESPTGAILLLLLLLLLSIRSKLMTTWRNILQLAEF